MSEPELVVLTPTFYPEKVGTPHYVTDMVKELAWQGHQIQVVANQPYYPSFKRFEGYGRLTRHDRLGHVPVHRLPTLVPRGGSRVARILSECNMLLQVAVGLMVGRLRRASHVVAVSPGVPFAILAGALLCSSGGRLTVVVHDIGFGLAHSAGGRLGRMLSSAVRWVEVRALNLADRVTVLSDAMGRSLARAGVQTPIETVELWPTVSLDDVATAPKPMTVQYSGNLGRKQGVHRLLDLAERLRRDVPEAHLEIRGDGSERAVLEREAETRGLSNVSFSDFVPVEKLALALSEAAVHVVPQLPEGADFAVPSKIVNTLAVGRPVVVTAREESPLGQLSNQCSAVVLVGPQDPDTLADEVTRLLHLDGAAYEKLSIEARRWARQHDRSMAVARTVAYF